MAKGQKGSSPSDENKPIRTSFIIEPLTMKKIRYISVMREEEITQLVKEGLEYVISQYEKKNGAIPVK